MCCPYRVTSVLLLTSLLFGASASVDAQVATPVLPSWDSGSPGETVRYYGMVGHSVAVPLARDGARRSHTKTGLLIGGLVGAAATSVFLVAFCSDPDTACGADEIGRAVVFIAVPCAAVGALVGSLIRTED